MKAEQHERPHVAHQSLYRTYRPQTFSDVVGQEHIERTLRNAVAEGTVAHAYLFTGPRGTGKTTTARILAKALDCDSGPTPDPDGTCEQCIEIAEGRHPDVYEIDAASRTGVENVREEIIGRVQFAPSRGRYKVYIIDEVHMLSAAAFNALLKTLEEPPSHVVFVLATTHPHKVPETIQSRCQRFDFRRIGIDDIVSRLRFICDAEKFDVSDPALALIARHAAGGMRDAITTLEQLASFTGGTIGLEDVEGLLGEVDSAQLFEIAGLVARRDIAECFRWVARFAEEGTDLAEFVRELTGHFRDLYVITAVGDAGGVIDATAEERSRLEAQAALFGGLDRLARMLDLLGELASEMRWSSDPRLSLEVALTRMARPQGEMTLEALAERVEAIEQGASAPVAPRPAATPAPARAGVPAKAASAKAKKEPAKAEPQAPPAEAPAPEPEPASEPVVVETSHAGGLDRAAARRAWPAVIAEVKKRKAARAQLFAGAEVDADADARTLVVEFPADQGFSMQLAEEPEMREMLQRAIAAVLGYAPPVRFRLGHAPSSKAETTPPEPAAETPAPGTRENATHRGDADEAERYESSVGITEPGLETRVTPAETTAPSDLQQLLVNGLGAEIVAEHSAQPLDDASESDSADDETDTPETGLLDPELFDNDPREDDQ